MSMKRCKTGLHFFDTEKHNSCPYCSGELVFFEEIMPGESEVHNPENDKEEWKLNRDDKGKTEHVSPDQPLFGDVPKTVISGGRSPEEGTQVTRRRSAEQKTRIADHDELLETETVDLSDNAGSSGEQGKTVIYQPDAIKPGSDKTQSLDPSVPRVVGWLVVVKGVDKPKDFPLIQGMNWIGRNPNMQVSLSDLTVSRSNHAFIMYNHNNHTFRIKHDKGGNLTFVNGEEALDIIQLNAFDRVEIGGTEMLFVPLCGEHFDWASNSQSNRED